MSCACRRWSCLRRSRPSTSTAETLSLPARVRGHPPARGRRRATAVRRDRSRTERSSAERAHGRAGRGAGGGAGRGQGLRPTRAARRRRRRPRRRGGVVARRGARARARHARPAVAALLALERRGSGGVGARRDRAAGGAVVLRGSPLDQPAGPGALRRRRRRGDRRARARADRTAAAAAGASRPIWRRSARCSCSSPTSSIFRPEEAGGDLCRRAGDGHHPVPPRLPARAGERGARRPRDARRHGFAVRRLEHLPAGGVVPDRADRLRHARAVDRRADRALVRGGLRRSAAGRDVTRCWPPRRSASRWSRWCSTCPIRSVRCPSRGRCASGCRCCSCSWRSRASDSRAARAPRVSRRRRPSGSRASGRWRPSRTRRSCSRRWRASRRGSRRRSGRLRRLAYRVPGRGARLRDRPRAVRRSDARRHRRAAGLGRVPRLPARVPHRRGRRAHLRRPALEHRDSPSAPATWRRPPRWRSCAPRWRARRARTPGADRHRGHHRVRQRADGLLRRPLAGPHPHLRRAAHRAHRRPLAGAAAALRGRGRACGADAGLAIALAVAVLVVGGRLVLDRTAASRARRWPTRRRAGARCAGRSSASGTRLRWRPRAPAGERALASLHAGRAARAS